MDKLLIVIEVPSISEYYETWVPSDLPVAKLLPLIVSSIKELSGGRYSSSGTELLCSKSGNCLLENKILPSQGISNGDHIIIF